jgi:hypothetical protein
VVFNGSDGVVETMNVDCGPWLSVDAQITSPVASRYFQMASTKQKVSLFLRVERTREMLNGE